jgi:hypothetical protein
MTSNVLSSKIVSFLTILVIALKGDLPITRGKQYPDKISFLIHSLGIAPPRVDGYDRRPSAVVRPPKIAPSFGRNETVHQKRVRD